MLAVRCDTDRPAAVHPPGSVSAIARGPARWLGRQLPRFAVLSAAASLFLRVFHRGPYFPGWDILGASRGLFLVSTRTPREILRFYIDHHNDGSIGWNVYGVPLTLLPGWLASRWPSEYWPHLITLLIVLVSLWLLARAVALRPGESWIVVLGWGASSALLSFSVAGFAYISSILPYALALWIVLRQRRRWVVAILLCPFVFELSWQLHELGRTVFVVFLVGALLLPDVPWKTRAVWFVAGMWHAWYAFHHQTFNTAHYSGMTIPALDQIGAGLRGLGTRFVTLGIDIPLLILAGMLSAALKRGDRWFWCGLLGCHLGLIMLLSINTGSGIGVNAIWPRRTLLLSFLCLAAAVAFYRERQPGAGLIVALLVAGNLWQLGATMRWAAQPLDREGRGSGFTLPYVDTTLDYMVSFFVVDWYQELRARLDAGKKLLLLYNFSSYEENGTNPSGVLERLYLHLGHARFTQSVFVFGSVQSRWAELPIHPLSDIPAFVSSVSDPLEFEGYWMIHPADSESWAEAERYRSDMTAVLNGLNAHFHLEWAPPVEDRQHRVLLRFVMRAA